MAAVFGGALVAMIPGGFAGAVAPGAESVRSDAPRPQGSTRGAPSRAVFADEGAGFLPTCAPGPSRVSEMAVTPGGYLKASRSGPVDPRSFYFARAMYSENSVRLFFRRGGDYLGDRGPSWSIDYPSADHHMMLVARRLSNLDACEWGQPVSLADPNLRRFPFLYSLEWGDAELTEQEVRGLRGYLQAGGLLMLDDFWGTSEWLRMEEQLRRVLPDHRIVDVPRDHLLFRAYYRIEGEIIQVPNAGNGQAVGAGIRGARTWEQNGYEPYIRGVFDEEDRLMVVIYANTDLGDAMEWAEDPYYPIEYSTFASQIFLNTIIYAMTQ